MFSKGEINMSYPLYVKGKLLETIREAAQDSRSYCKNPDKDFTRNRKIPFEEMLTLIIMMEGSSIKKELLDYFNYNIETATSSAFIQQRSKITFKAFEYIFHKFNSLFPEENLYKGYRILACDGSNIITPSNPKDKNCHYNHIEGIRTFNMIHINAVYDLVSNRYIDATVEPGYHINERGALETMLSRLHRIHPSIFIADRGYASYNMYAFAEENNIKYIIRSKECNVFSLLKGCDLAYDYDFDYQISLQLTTHASKTILAQPKVYKYINKKSFNYFNEEGFYPITFRVVRITLDDGSYEYLFTNLSKEEFNTMALKELYHLRWGIETSFRELKYATGLINLHSKKAEHITQEIFAKLILYNFCEIITTHVIIQKKERKHAYQLNFTLAITICKYFLRYKGDKEPPDVEALIQKELLPVRNNRKYPRKMHNKAPVSFLYRVA